MQKRVTKRKKFIKKEEIGDLYYITLINNTEMYHSTKTTINHKG